MFKLTEAEIMANWSASEPIRVSVCCITYKQEQYISQAIDSFLMQKTTFPFEIIIGEDCGGDDTRYILAKYQAQYPNIIKIITSENNVGANANLLRVINAAVGDFIAVCEGDDYWCSAEKLQIQYNLMVQHPDVTLSYHSAYVLTEDNQTLGYVKPNSKHRVDDVISTKGMFAPTASYVFKRNIINVLPSWFVEAPIGDYFIEIYSLKMGVGLYIDSPMCVYRTMANNSWSSKIHTDVTSYTNMRLEMIKYDKLTKLDFPNLADLIDARIALTYVVIVRWLILNEHNSEARFYLNKVSISDFNSVRDRIKCIIYKSLSRSPKLLKYLITKPYK